MLRGKGVADAGSNGGPQSGSVEVLAMKTAVFGCGVEGRLRWLAETRVEMVAESVAEVAEKVGETVTGPVAGSVAEVVTDAVAERDGRLDGARDGGRVCGRVSGRDKGRRWGRDGGRVVQVGARSKVGTDRWCRLALGPGRGGGDGVVVAGLASVVARVAGVAGAVRSGQAGVMDAGRIGGGTVRTSGAGAGAGKELK